MLLVKIAGGVVLIALIVAFFMRGRTRAVRPSRQKGYRPTLPPSPYQPSRGFRLLGDNEPEAPHQVELPRLDPNTEFVFNDPLASSETVSAPHLRHDERWALERSVRHGPHPHVRRRRRLLWALLLALVAAGLIVAFAVATHPARQPVSLAGRYAVAPSSWMMNARI